MLVILTQQMVMRSISISGKISEDITFLHKMFPVPPSKRAIIEVDVSYPNSSDRIHNPIMGIYTTHNHVNIKKQCSYVQYSQLGNQVLHPTIRLDESDIQTSKMFERRSGHYSLHREY